VVSLRTDVARCPGRRGGVLDGSQRLPVEGGNPEAFLLGAGGHALFEVLVVED
jgi:hypothetical protein